MMVQEAALPDFYRPAYDPYAEAQPVLVCPECGAPVYAGEKYVCGRGTDHILACEHCADIRAADFV